MIPMNKHLSLCGLAACFLISCDDDSENAPFVIYTVSGTLTAGSNLSGTGTGTFIYTVNDAPGNTDGSAQLLEDVFSLRGRVSGRQVNLQFQEGKKYSNGNILGSESSGGFSGTFWISDASGAQVKGTAEGTRSGASSGTGSGTGSGSSGMDYDNVVNPAKGPYTENYSLSNCQLSIGGKTYKKS